MTSADSIYKNIADFNRDIKRWGGKVRRKLRGNVRSLSNEGTGALAKSIRASFKKPGGEIEMISYKFPRHGVFFAKGVGRGHVMQGGRVVRGVKSGKTVKLIGGEVNRQPKDWFNSTLEDNIGDLADTVADHKADKAAVEASRMKIR